MTVIEGVTHSHCRMLTFFLTQSLMLLQVAIHSSNDILPLLFITGLLTRILVFLTNIEVVAELVKFLLAERSSQVNNECYWNCIKHVLVHVFIKF